MNLVWKLFFSYVIVLGIGLGVLAAFTSYAAPVDFSHQMMGYGWMRDHDSAEEGWRGQGNRGMGMMSEETRVELDAELNAELETAFRDTLNRSLLRAGAAAALAAIIVSWLISRRITRPIRSVVSASHHIVDGHYEQRLPVQSRDEMGELVQSFNQMAAALSETETMRQQLIGDVTHELKTPLASIKGYMEGLQDGVIPATPETFQLVHREADRLQRLVLDLQELSRMEAVVEQLKIAPYSASELIETAVQRLQPQFAEKGVLLTLETQAAAPLVRADSDRTVQVLINLLGNALQYTPSGGDVKLGITESDHAMQFYVQDSGIGLAPDDTKRIFQRFYRVDKSRSRSSGGSGIGLTIAQLLIEAQQGRLWAESAGLGKGSTFNFTLPLAL